MCSVNAYSNCLLVSVNLLDKLINSLKHFHFRFSVIYQDKATRFTVTTRFGKDAAHHTERRLEVSGSRLHIEEQSDGV